MSTERLQEVARLAAKLKEKVLDDADSAIARQVLGGWLRHLECVARGDTAAAHWELMAISYPDLCLYSVCLIAESRA